ncbi:hypothetical protein GCM10011515_21540 [Tsuneonella deserti]|uniref:Uncharacterized protein n=1 Tax=Tsuneonella deserti TaxID=2035528 RepID=A0ABQ1S9X6_9SPHN|nr:hypothetical protein [Tsuneonella deserti]GGE01447.1 hypothetical protein GCM10011515_21540 [Tsuneonella deserti]
MIDTPQEVGDCAAAEADRFREAVSRVMASGGYYTLRFVIGLL